MPWWWIVYLVAFSGLHLAGIVDDIQSRAPRWLLVTGLFSYAFCVVFVFGICFDAVASPIGRWALPMLIYVVGMDFYAASRDFERIEQDGDSSKLEIVSIVAGVAVLSLPAYIAGVVLAVRSFQTAS